MGDNDLLIALVGDWLCKACMSTSKKKKLSGGKSPVMIEMFISTCISLTKAI